MVFNDFRVILSVADLKIDALMFLFVAFVGCILKIELVPFDFLYDQVMDLVLGKLIWEKLKFVKLQNLNLYGDAT